MEHDVVTHDEKQITVANVRTLIYSDGAHNQGTLKNDFANGHDGTVDPTLMTTYFGRGDDGGAEQMMALSGTCPTHGLRNYFLINSPERYRSLRGLFRMASGASGFCPACLANPHSDVAVESEVSNDVAESVLPL